MLIDFVHLGDSYLPELNAYERFLLAAGHGARVHRSADSVPPDASVAWWMCGLVPADAGKRLPSAFHVHEYASASVPPWALVKDTLKRWRQPRPDYRIFQNDWVHDRFRFSDGVPCDFRDMGLDPKFLQPGPSPATPDFDFVYLGEMSRLRHFLSVFEAIGRLGHRVLLVGDLPLDLARTLGRLVEVTTTGRVPHDQVPACLRRARVGLNLVPATAPFAHQTSTKLLEYCASGLGVLSTDYPWVGAFEARHGCRFTYLPARVSRTELDARIRESLATEPSPPIHLNALAWPEILARLRVWRAIGVLP